MAVSCEVMSKRLHRGSTRLARLGMPTAGAQPRPLAMLQRPGTATQPRQATVSTLGSLVQQPATAQLLATERRGLGAPQPAMMPRAIATPWGEVPRWKIALLRLSLAALLF